MLEHGFPLLCVRNFANTKNDTMDSRNALVFPHFLAFTHGLCRRVHIHLSDSDSRRLYSASSSIETDYVNLLLLARFGRALSSNKAFQDKEFQDTSRYFKPFQDFARHFNTFQDISRHFKTFVCCFSLEGKVLIFWSNKMVKSLLDLSAGEWSLGSRVR